MNNDKGKYPITVSDWLRILQDKCTITVNIHIFLATVIIATVIAIPTIYSINKNQSSSITMVFVTLFLWILYVWARGKLHKYNEPYEKLYSKIIQGEITEPTEILKEYNLIEEMKEKKKRDKIFKINKSRILDYILAFIVLLIIPSIGFYLISSITPLEPILYVIASLSGFFIICFLSMLEIHRNLKSKSWKAINFILLIMIIPVLGFYGFDLIIPIQLTSQHFAEAGFSYLFSLCVTVGYKLMLPYKNNNFNLGKK